MKYICEWKIKTLAENYVNAEIDTPSFELNGIVYTPWEFNWGAGHIEKAWLATFTIECSNAIEAHKLFRKRMLDTVPKIALISQCYTEFLSQPFLIKKESETYAYFYNIFDSEAVPLHFDQENYDSLKLLVENRDVSEQFYDYWNDATNASSFTPKLTLLFSALESLCKDAGGILDKAKLKNILGNELYDDLYANNNRGLRHRLIHGDYFQESDFSKNYVLLIHDSVRKYFNANIFNYDAINGDIVGPQRNFDGNKSYAASFVEAANKDDGLTLKELVNDFDTQETRFKGKYEYKYDQILADF